MKISEAQILLTGAAGALGAGTAASLRRLGAGLSLVDHREEALEALDLPGAKKYVCDLTRPEAVAGLVDRLKADAPFPNVLINNAGLIHSEPLVNILKRPDPKHSAENWHRVMNINLHAVFYLGAAMAETWIKQRSPGLIINISSIAAGGNAGQSAYAASKAAVEALTKTWSKELGVFRIRCACIAPGFLDVSSTHDGLAPHIQEKWKKSIPIARFGLAEELVSAIAFLIENDYFNGKVLALDGGLSI